VFGARRRAHLRRYLQGNGHIGHFQFSTRPLQD